MPLHLDPKVSCLVKCACRAFVKRVLALLRSDSLPPTHLGFHRVWCIIQKLNVCYENVSKPLSLGVSVSLDNVSKFEPTCAVGAIAEMIGSWLSFGRAVFMVQDSHPSREDGDGDQVSPYPISPRAHATTSPVVELASWWI